MTRPTLIPLNLDWDFSCGIPTQYLSFICRNVIPLWQCKRPSLNAVERQINTQLHPFIHVDQNTECILSGCVFDDTYVPSLVTGDQNSIQSPTCEDPNDLVVLLLQKNIRVAPSSISMKRDGITAVQIPGTDRVNLTFQTKETDQIDNISHITRGKTGVVEVNGSSLPFKCTTALPHLDWPEIAMEWLVRDRLYGWPDRELVQDITSLGCHVVKTDKDAKSSSKWCYSFTVAEQRLFNSLNDVQKQCFRFLKVINSTYLNTPGFFTIRDLKILFFWVCERVPVSQWTDVNLGACIVMLLDELICAIGSKKLPHYFMRDINLLKDKDAATLHSFGRKVTAVRHTPLEFLFSRNLSFQPKTTPLKNVFRPLLDDIKAFHLGIDPRDFFKTSRTCIENLANAYVTDDQIEDSMKLWEDYVYFMSLLELEVRLDEDVMISACELKNKIKLYKYYIEKLQEPEKAMTLYANLGNVYTRYAFGDPDLTESEKCDILQKADDSFQMAMAHALSFDVGCHPVIWTEYAKFLCAVDRQDAATHYLEEVIDKEHSNMRPHHENVVLANTTFPVDENIKREMSHHGHLHILSVIYSFYMLTSACLTCQGKDAALVVVKRFDDKCNRLIIDDFEMRATAFTLLGYAYKNLEEFTSAMEAFGEVLAIAKNHPTARENKDECEAIHMSLSCIEDLDLD